MTVPPALHPEVFAWMVATLDSTERDEFFDGLAPMLDKLKKASTAHDVERVTATAHALHDFLESWRLSLLVASHPDFDRQVKIAESEWDDLGLDGAVTAESLKDVLQA